MGKRIAIKTTLICFGIFLILSSITLTMILKKYPLDTENRVTVMIAAVDIEEGTVIEEKHIRKKVIQQSAASGSMVTDRGMVMGRKAVHSIPRNDYLRTGDLINEEDWYDNDDRIIILPVSIEERLANLIRKGSFIDIRLKSDMGAEIKTILTKVKVEDVLDEAGNPLESKAGTNSKTAYMKLVLNDSERQKVYFAASSGKLFYELYCSELQIYN